MYTQTYIPFNACVHILVFVIHLLIQYTVTHQIPSYLMYIISTMYIQTACTCISVQISIVLSLCSAFIASVYLAVTNPCLDCHCLLTQEQCPVSHRFLSQSHLLQEILCYCNILITLGSDKIQVLLRVEVQGRSDVQK